MTPEQAASGLLGYIQKHVPEGGTALLAGNSVHADRAFLQKQPYKRVLNHLHYRIFDVSSMKEAAQRWWYVMAGSLFALFADLAALSQLPVRTSHRKTLTRPNSPEIASRAPRKRGLHKAREDILESIEEARYYKNAIFQAARS